MKAIAVSILLLTLALLAGLSGATKIQLQSQDVEFFGRYGFSSAVLVLFGILQVAGAVMLLVPRSRFWGAALIAATFLFSLVLLVLDGNVPMSIATFVITMILCGVMYVVRPQAPGTE